ncbi:EH signature domain-containing protein [Blastomonas aquatica]|uniref:Zorya protein ZorC EH domain-containing protein n=1 Tax=Blastomonas aquatica TaxID=1510276 RepID=A0ABQ1IVK4_9SPHN|nr:EH signature domain-containing protein [Blastomonas aquatica]GGB51600.1 hypothetical protein GCM10010833_02900 [Blastomonas aquatica]
MTHLAKLVADPKLFAARLRVGAVEPAQLRRSVSGIVERGEKSAREVEEIGVVQQRIADWSVHDASLRLSRRDLRLGCQAVLHPPLPPAGDEAVLDGLLREVERNERRAAFFAVIDAYLDGFDDANETIMTLACKLEAMVSRWPWREKDDWPAKISQFSLLDPVKAPDVLANRILAGEKGALKVLQDAGLETAGRRFGGLVEAAFRSACHLVTRMKGQDAVTGQNVLIEWARDEGGRFGYQRAWPDFVEASLTPWELEEPSEAHKSVLLKMFERFGGGDPRTAPQRWRSVMDRSPGAYAVLMRWLTRASVLQFLDIVDRLMPDHASKLMWSYRRAFWMSYLLSDGSSPGIDAAWVAFGDDGAQLARKIARETGDKSFTAFGKQTDKSAQHAALILQIGDLTIVDWSHSAKYQVWKRGDKGVPALFKHKYNYKELYSAPIQESHVAPKTFSWQKNLAKTIEQRNFYSAKPSWRPRSV